jgi:hypothetical protein
MGRINRRLALESIRNRNPRQAESRGGVLQASLRASIIFSHIVNHDFPSGRGGV